MKDETEQAPIDPAAYLSGTSLDRRTLLQSIPGVALASVLPGSARASGAQGAPLAPESRRLKIDRKYILVPINEEASARRVRLFKDGRLLRSFKASLGLPAQWWAHLDVSAWKGETLTLAIELNTVPPRPGEVMLPGRGASETSNAEIVGAVHTSADVWSPETLYKEPLRPAFHFSAKRGWINDPNGLMYHNGQYHLFFQTNPYALRGGNSHWGHAVSTDLVHWKELGIALYPRDDSDLAYSGAGVVDHMNTSGWAKNGKPPMVIAFTSTSRGECIAYSNDDGLTWTEYAGNPVVKHSGRDTKLLWHAPSDQWVMAVYSKRPGTDAAAPVRHGIAFYTSADLKTWRERSRIEGYFECPDLFELPVDGDPGQMKWVLSCAPGYYAIGTFDGAQFIAEGPHLPGPAGGRPDALNKAVSPFLPFPFYAAQTFSNHPDGDVVQIAWGIIPTLDAPFTNMMSFPTKLALRTTQDGVRLCREPVEAIRSLRVRSHDIPAVPLTSTPLLTDLQGDAWDIETVIRIATVSPVILSIGGDDYVYRPQNQALIGPNGAMSIPLTDGRLRLRILVDHTSIEIFGDRGQAYGMFARSNPGGNAALALHSWETFVEDMQVEKLSAHALRSAWQPA